MDDQAEKLRRIMDKYSREEKTNKKQVKRAKFIAVTSGKGGVGKTNFTVNLAISLKELGYKVVIIDGDLGLANVDLITGIDLKNTISDMFSENKSIFEIMNEGPNGIKIVSGASGFKELRLLSGKNLISFIKEIEKLENYYDFVIIDTGVGISRNVTEFLALADELVLVTTPDPTSLMDGYALLKTIIIYGYERNINIIVNMAGNGREAKEVYNNLNTASNRFLKRNIEFLGYLNKSSIVVNAVKKQKPFILDKPNSIVSKKMNIIASEFANENKSVFFKSKSFSERFRDFFLRKGVQKNEIK